MHVLRFGTGLLWMAVAAAGAWAQAGSVAGHVFCADTGTPCRFASVALEEAPPLTSGAAPDLQSGSSVSSAGTTDLDGAFQISGVTPGDYYVTARLAGYVSAYDLANSEYPDDSGRRREALEAALVRVTVESNQTAVATVSLTRGANLGGTVRFDDGGVANNVPVRLFEKDATGKWQPAGNAAGGARVGAAGVTRTDDRGRFHASGLAPGSYTIAVQLPEARLPANAVAGRGPARPGSVGGLQIFNGNVYRLRDAAVIAVRAGENLDAVDITIPTHGLHTLRGVVNAVSDGGRPLRGSVRLLDPDDKTMLREASLQADGSFEFHYVMSGQYLVTVDVQTPGWLVGASYAPLTSALAVDGDLTSLSYTVTAAAR